MAKKNHTEILYPVPGSIFLEYTHCANHFAISLQKTTVFDEKLNFLILVKFQKVINIAKKNRTEMLYPVPGSIFLEYTHCANHFAISPQKM